MTDIREWADLHGEERMSGDELEREENYAYCYCYLCGEVEHITNYDTERDCCVFCLEDSK